ncbi:alpha-(1,3)-fucosyltransferase C-like [Penaeus japonicus]|uniref:alpha-(1,3)-fucosyltransferase C-like n=1 Tax=Penaeus japonicus TaxID=27405 RepID=UPI001C71499A|nr:alpha-(1,3)-fucosyltransferase C-like [Penaeus japonicus]
MQTKKVIPVAIISASLLTFLFYENVLKRDFFSASAIRERLATWRHGAAAELARTHEALESPHSSHRDTEGNDSLSASTTRESQQNATTRESQQNATTRESQQNATTRESQNVQLGDEQSSPLKKIVVLSTKFFSLAISSQLASQGCPEPRCFIISNASEAEDADAVVFHAKFTTITSVPKKRHSHQRYIWYNLESPPHTRRKARLMNFYNWTYTYHRNSDLLRPYGALLPLTAKKLPIRAPTLDESKTTLLKYKQDLKAGLSLEDDREKDWESFLRRPRLVVWMVSHCRTHSRRENYVKELQKHVEVTVFGKCGRKRCKKSGLNRDCFTNVLARNFSFYLSFENSICNDYMTEKVWNALLYGLVPVVYGGANYSAYLPPNSYIDANNLQPRDLASLLKSIAATPREYARYHLWRLHWKVVLGWPHCELCYRLHNDHSVTSYMEPHAWWNAVGHCRSPLLNFKGTMRKETDKD